MQTPAQKWEKGLNSDFFTDRTMPNLLLFLVARYDRQI
jgi:hypothetical protein